MSLSVAALIATYRRPHELQRLLQSLLQVTGLSTVIVVDNEGSAEVQALVEKAYPGAQYLSPGANLGCGGGLKLAEQRALQMAEANLTHVLILDDDAVLAPDTITVLAETMERAQADLAYPLVTDARGHVGWLPGLIQRVPELRDAFDGTPEEFRARFGTEPRDFLWAQGVCLLVKRTALERHGPHRDDFWVRGEDLEFSLRFTAQARGILVPAVAVQHLPPPDNTALSREAEYLKHSAMVQNIAFIGFRLPHGRRIAWTILGALRRFFRLWSWPAVADAIAALWRGAVLGEPAGAGTGRTFRARFAALPPAP
ncbi:glycosyl transferase family 2 [Chthoniobacter flavus Ellin428]|uniref:Glycosyl transferase family 2 n=1 Tax=Chthoniobacter flavus Ellin428 TaxID=497964 RepID=B4CTS2_9BACT|nr:glycosyltransferase [Chthoniobacter flavus]EDY21960.1 glycosyl transferase family 2 [Chthoniobacter flavus Ellin428]TCO89348.1 GT2 family glycosyltransferase [Chthoniobacter flavus]